MATRPNVPFQKWKPEGFHYGLIKELVAIGEGHGDRKNGTNKKPV
jgi:hypothetical protein